MGVPTVLALIAVVIGVIEEFRTQGQSLPGWGIILLGAALLWGDVITT